MPAQKKKKALIQQQLGDFFRMELNRVFGPEPQTPELPIDQAALASIGILSVPWTECHVENFYEGIHNGLHFSAANVALRVMRRPESRHCSAASSFGAGISATLLWISS